MLHSWAAGGAVAGRQGAAITAAPGTRLPQPGQPQFYSARKICTSPESPFSLAARRFCSTSRRRCSIIFLRAAERARAASALAGSEGVERRDELDDLLLGVLLALRDTSRVGVTWGDSTYDHHSDHTAHYTINDHTTEYDRHSDRTAQNDRHSDYPARLRPGPSQRQRLRPS